MTDADRLTIRRADPADLPQVIDVCSSALQWSGDDADVDFFSWKHVANPFGPSPIWIAEDEVDGERRIVGVRAMMRWEFQRSDSTTMRMARAVDTATLPSHQGKGIFSRLTMAAVEELTAEGVGAIFNTPNDKSRPGYLKMGWQEVGRVPVTARPRSPLALVTMARSKVAAERWGIPTEAGSAPAEAFADRDRLDAVVAASAKPDRWSTPLSADYLDWRTSFKPLACRVELLGSTIDDGFVVFRLRQRGALRQLSLLHIVQGRSGTGSRGLLRKAVGRLMASTKADLAMAAGGAVSLGDGLLPLPSIGPLLTWRALAEQTVPEMSELHLPMGAIELF